MSGNMERIPIISLSGCKSLTDVLTELPIPQPSHIAVGCRTLLYEPKLVHDAYRCINTEDPNLIQLLRSALSSVSVDHLSFKETSSEPQDGNKVLSLPSLLCALEKSGAFLSRQCSEPQSDVISGISNLSNTYSVSDNQPNRGSSTSDNIKQDTPTSLRDSQPAACDEKTSESYSAVHIAPLRIALKKCMNIKESPAKKGKKSRRKPDVLEVSSNLSGGARDIHVSPVVEEKPNSEHAQAQLPILQISTPLSKATPSLCTTNGEAQRTVTSSEYIPPTCPTSLNPPAASIPFSGVTVDENPVISVASSSSIEQLAAECMLTVSHSPKPAGDCSVISESSNAPRVTPPFALTTTPATIVHTSVSQNVTSTVLTTAVSTTNSHASVSPESAISNSVNPEITSSRRIPDPALSQIFHSAALFHTYQPHIEPEKSGSCAGGGLFDDWLDSSVKTTESSLLYPVNDGVYSGSLSGPSSVVNVPSNCSQAPHSVGASADVSVCAPRTPLSVPSNHSSYPATPGGGLTTVALSVNTAVNTIMASPSTLPKNIYQTTGVTSPSVRLFNTSESGTESHEPAVEEQSRIAPLGLAAYLPRSGSLRPNFSNTNDDGLLSEDGRTHSPGTAASPDGIGSRSCGTTEGGSKPSSTNKHSKFQSYTNASPIKSAGRGRLSSGKPRGGGRRRRTELEELKMWSVNDRAQALGDKKVDTTPDSLDVFSGDLREAINTAASHVPDTAPADMFKGGEEKINSQHVISSDSHEGFTEALVERVKRRRQQHQIEKSKSRSGLADRHLYRSSDVSPASTPSPARSVGRGREVDHKATKTNDLKNQHKSRQFISDQRMTINTIQSDRSHSKRSRHKSSDSDASFSPPSTGASSVQSSKPSSVSSCLDSVPPALEQPGSLHAYPTGMQHSGSAKVTISDSNDSNTVNDSSDCFFNSFGTPSKHSISRSSTTRPFTSLIDNDRIHDRLSVESHFSSPSRTLFNDKTSHSSSLSPNNRIQRPNEAFIDDAIKRHSSKQHQSRHFVSHVHSSLVNKTDAHMKRRRRVVISDDEEPNPTYTGESPTLQDHSHPLPRLEEFDQKRVAAQPLKSKELPEVLLPPVLQPLNDTPTMFPESVAHRTAGSSTNINVSNHQPCDHKDLVGVKASSRMSSEFEAGKIILDHHLTDSSKFNSLNGSETSLSTAHAGHASHGESMKVDSRMSRSRTRSPGTEVPFSSDDDTAVFDKAHGRASHQSPSNDSVGSLTSSSQLASTYGGVFLPDPGCPTPSTIAYTHSSAMGDSDSRDSDLDSLPRESEQHREADSGLISPNNSSQSIRETQDSDLSDESWSQEKGSNCSSPSSLSAHSEDDQPGSADDSDEARHRSEELTGSVAAVTQFTARLKKILQRVEELDLLGLSTKVNEHRRPTHSGADAEPDTSFDEHLIPDAARLTRRELSALYSESAQVRLSGSMFCIPTGRLVRFLTLLLVNMQAGAHTTPAPLTQAEVDHFLRIRQETESQHRDGSRRSQHQSQQLTESILWANPLWASVLTALDCARIALNIIAAPDMPRPLLMEDLIDGIVSVVRCQLEGVVCKPSTNERTTNHQLGFSKKQLWNFACESVGFRTAQLMSVLSGLVRFQPNRFTDNLVIRLTELGLTVPMYCLTSGQSMERDPKRLCAPVLRKLLHSSASGEHKLSFPVGPSRLLLLGWPDRLQRGSLALLAGLYNQYEVHRKLIVDEIFRTLLSQCVLTNGNNSNSGEDALLTVSTSSDKRAARTFRILSSHWLYKQNRRHKQADRICSSVVTDGADPPPDAAMDNHCGSEPQYIHIHALTALFLSLIQGLVQSPGSSSSSSTGGGPGSAARKAVSTPGSGEQNNLDNSQFLKDEKQVLASYTICLRHAHHLFSGLLKRVCVRTELDLRPVLNTVTCDLLALATAAPIEWPVAPTLLCVLGSLLIQHISQNNAPNTTNTNTTSARNWELSSKLVCLDTMATLALGLKRSAVLSLEHRSSLRRPETASRLNPSMRNADRSGSNETEDSTTTEANIRRRELIAQTQVVGFISSPMPMLNTWLLQSGSIELTDEGVQFGPGRHQERDCMKNIRLEYADYLLVTAQRFFLASWLHNCTRDLGEALTHAKNRRSSVETTSASSSKSASKLVRELEQLRHQLLSELALTHHLPSSSLPWLTGSRHSSSLVGSSSLSSPSNKPVRQNSSSHFPGSGVRTSSGSTPSRMLVYGGSFLSFDLATKRFVEYAHSRHLDRKLRLRLAAHAHWSAWQLLSLHPVIPGFEKLFSAICRLVGESSVPIRTKALRCLAAVIEVDPRLFIHSSSSKDPEHQSPTQANWLRELPRLVHARLLDNSASVREAAVDLVSKLLVLRPRALPEYYPMLAERVLDKGVSVRKRAIRCFRDLLVVDWDGDGGVDSTVPGKARPRGKQKFVLMTNQLGVEMCIKLIRRLHDEDSIQKLVIELFHSLWFTPIPETNVHCSRLLDRRILSLSKVTQTLRSSSFEVLESFLKQILTTNDSIKHDLLHSACVQLVNRLITLIKRLSASFLSSNQRRYPEQSRTTQLSDSSLPMPKLQGLLASLHLLSRCKPELFRVHCEYLVNLLRKAPLAPLTPTSNAVVASSTNSPASSQQASDTLLGLDAQCLYHLISVIEMTLFSIASDSRQNNVIADHLSVHRLTDLQLDLVRLIQRQGRLVVDSALSCLATLTNRVIKDHTQVVVCFAQFYGLLTNLSADLRRAPSMHGSSPSPISSRTRPSVLRALYTVGLMCKHFALDDLLSEDKRMSTNTDAFLDEIVDTLMLFAKYASSSPLEGRTPSQQMNDTDICRKAIMGMGFLVCRHDRLLCEKHVSSFFSRFFTSNVACSSLITSATASGSGNQSVPSSYHEVQCIILDNLTHYLMDNERQMVADNRSWSVRHKSESLKELTDQRSGHGSAVAQSYLPLVLKHCILTPALNVRTSALGLLTVILRQGLVHPVQILSYLICLQTDPDSGNRSRATHLLAEAERKVPGFIAMRAAPGIQLSYQLHLLLSTTAASSGSHRGTSQSTVPLIRGATEDNLNCASSDSASATTTVNALNHSIYALLRSNRQSRRSLISSLLSLFDSDQNTEKMNVEHVTPALHTLNKPCLGQLVFITDQLAHFPYSVLDEVLFIAYHIEQRLSVNGSSLVRQVQQALLSSLLSSETDSHRGKKDTGTDKSQLEAYLLNLIEAAETKVLAGNPRKMERWTETHAETTNPDWDQGGKLHALFEKAQHSRTKARQAMFSQGPICWLLLTLRQHLRDFFGVTDSKLKDYSPSDSPKQWERSIVLPKRTPNGNHLLRLPTLVVQCLNHPDWSQLDPGPPDTIVLYQFIRLRHQLLALEDSSPVVGFLSPTPVTALPTDNVLLADERQTKPVPEGHHKVEVIALSGNSASEPSTDVEISTKKLASHSPGNAYQSKREPSHKVTTHRTRESSHSRNECKRDADASVLSNSPSRHASVKHDASATSRADHRHAEKSQTRKRRSRLDSISSLSSSSSGSSSSRSATRSVGRPSTTGVHSKASHSLVKQARVVEKSGTRPSNCLSSTAAHSKPSVPGASSFETSEPPVPPSRAHLGSKRPLDATRSHCGKRAPKLIAPPSSLSSSSTDLESSNSDASSSATEAESVRAHQSSTKAVHKQSAREDSTTRHSSHKRPPKALSYSSSHHLEVTKNTGAPHSEPTEGLGKDTSAILKRSHPKSVAQASKSHHKQKPDIAGSQSESRVSHTAKSSNKSSVVQARPSQSQATGSVRSLAPLPQAMMQSSHTHVHRSAVQNHNQKPNRKSLGASRSSGCATTQPSPSKPSISESRGAREPSARSHSTKSSSSKFNSNSTPTAVSAKHAKPTVDRSARERTTQGMNKTKLSKVSRLSDSSSDSDSERLAARTVVPEHSKRIDLSNTKPNKTNKNTNGTVTSATNTSTTTSAGTSNTSRRNRQRNSASVSSVSSSSSDISSSSSSSTSTSSTASSSSSPTTSTSDSSNRSLITKPNKQPRLGC